MRYAYVVGCIKEADSSYTVYVPDFPNIVGNGISIPELIEIATIQLRLMLRDRIFTNSDIPEPSSMDIAKQLILTTRKDAGMDTLDEDSHYQYILAPDIENNVVKITISLTKHELAEIDCLASAHGMTRSGYMTRQSLVGASINN